MKKLIFSFTVIILLSSVARSQTFTALEIPQQETYTTTGISSFIKTHFATDSERVRAIFVWVANNVDYDVEKVRLKKEERTTVSDVLNTRKAVCQGYADLMVALCNECNIPALMIPGYTKRPDGSIADLSHAWVAAQINNKWFLFDPTWASGSVNDYRFTKRFSDRYYKLLPQEMLKDHMPFDPMYQFINYPISYNEFNQGNVTINTSKPYFNYTDTIKTYNSLDTLHRLVNFADRINRNGEKNRLISEMLNVVYKNQNALGSKSGFEGAVDQFKQGTQLFNKYISYKNERFASIKDDKQIQQMIDDVLQHIHNAYLMLENVTANTDDQRKSLHDINSGLTAFYNRAEDENIFLKSYLKNRQPR